MLNLFKYLKKYYWLIVLILITAFGQVMADLYLPNLMSDIVNTGIVKNDVAYIIKVGSHMLMIALAGSVCAVLLSFSASKVATGFSKDLRDRVFTHVESFSLSEFDKIGTASLITRTTNDINQMQQVMIMIFRIAIIAPIMCVGGLFMALSKDVPLSLTFAVTIPILLIIVSFIGIKGLPLFKSIQVKIDKLNKIVREGLIGIRVVRAFNRIEYEKERFDKASKDLRDTSIKVNKIDRKSTRLNSSHANISYAVFCLKKKELQSSQFIVFRLLIENKQAVQFQ